MTDQGQPGLFDVATPERSRAFFATNRHNLLKALATRMLAPVEGYTDKYYDDLLRYAPGRIPLVARGVGTGLTALITDGDHDFPVLVEVDPAGLEGRDVPAMGVLGGRAGIGMGGATAWAPAGPMPFASVSAIHFRSERDLHEFSLNEYADVRPVVELLRTSPDLFEHEMPVSELMAWLKSLERPTVPDLVRLDRRGGALLMGAAAADVDEADLIVSILNGTDTGRSSHAGLVAWTRGESGPADDGDQMMTTIVLEEFAAVDRAEVWRPSEVIASVRARLALSGLAEEELRLASAALDRAEGIIRNDVAFERIREGGWSSLKALLLVFMRPVPERFANWDLGETGADQQVRFLAFTFLGALTGRSHLPVTLRPPLLDDIVAIWECGKVLGGDSAVPAVPPLTLSRHETGALIESAGQPVLAVQPPTPSYAGPLEVVQPPPAPDARDKTPEPVALAVAPDADAIVRALHDFDLRRKIVEYVELSGREDCLSTTVRGMAAGSRIEADDAGRIAVSLVGPISVERDVVDERFVARALAGDIPAETLGTLIVAAAPPPPAVPRPRKRRPQKAPASG